MPISVREKAQTAFLAVNGVPAMFNYRLLPLRSFNKGGIMFGAAVADDKRASRNIFDNQKIGYLNIHNAHPGCFNCGVSVPSCCAPVDQYSWPGHGN